LLKPVTLTLEPGDILTQVTDGLLEAHDAQRRQWGEARWMASVLAQHDETQAQALADRVVRDLKAFSPPPIADDLLVLVLALEQARSN
jgi:serine phosphatase RsbU (regulator of sigma subunit)